MKVGTLALLWDKKRPELLLLPLGWLRKQGGQTVGSGSSTKYTSELILELMATPALQRTRPPKATHPERKLGF